MTDDPIPESELVDDYDRPDEPDGLNPLCPVCEAVRGINKAIVAPASDGEHDVLEYVLECGHDLEDPDAVIGAGVVELVKLQNPEYIEVRS